MGNTGRLFFFRPLNGVPTIPDLIEAESFSGEWHFVIPKQRGRLHVQWQHAKDSESDAVSHVQLTLTARGPIDKDQGSNDNSAVISGLDLGRATVVRSFRHLMTVDANSEWKLKNASSS